MPEPKYHEVTIKVLLGVAKNGKEKTQRETYLVDALSVTEAEAKMHEYLKGTQLEYTVSAAKQSRIIGVL